MLHMNDISNAAPDTVTETAEPSPSPKAKGKNRFAAAQPVLEQLFELYPQLFGARFLPLKLGIFQDLMAAHPGLFKRDDLKTALGVHTRSSRYLQCVAAGLKRHDLAGQAVDEVAPEHVFLSIVELFARRQGRTEEDLRPKLRNQLLVAYEKSGLSRQDYLARIGVPTSVVQEVLDEVLEEVDCKRARRAALVQSFQASGKTPEEFADMLGMDVRDILAALRTVQATPAANPA